MNPKVKPVKNRPLPYLDVIYFFEINVKASVKIKYKLVVHILTFKRKIFGPTLNTFR